MIDWHSMPAIAARTPGGSCDLVLGDRFGVSCANQLTRQLERSFGELGYRVARNAPYAGGYTTEHYGRPGLQIHALQIVILVPQIHGFLTENVGYGVVRVLVAVGSREANDAGFHARSTLAMS
jgi:N-formylglutamate amidohydrolase